MVLIPDFEVFGKVRGCMELVLGTLSISRRLLKVVDLFRESVLSFEPISELSNVRAVPSKGYLCGI